MELPYNTTISGNLLKGTGRFAQPVADWPTKRRWVREAFEALEDAGYHVRSAYTAVKNPEHTRFLYTDRLWQGADMIGLGVASFGHVNGVHVQNLDTWETYSAAVRRDEIPLSRAYRPTGEERFIREFILQLKLGSIAPAYFRDKYHVNVLDRFRDQLDSLKSEGYLQTATDKAVALTREGLLRVDGLLPRFFLPQHAGIRYT
jgi:oxygen-independent coproporphyrinogen-3 oxidase